MENKAEYLYEQIRLHISRFFQKQAIACIENTKINFIGMRECINAKEKSIVIPIDIENSLEPTDIYKVKFNDTEVTLWNKIDKPEGWNSIPSDNTPIWYINDYGSVMPAWNLFYNIYSLLTLDEEVKSKKRDEHDRFIANYSPRSNCNLLEVPAFNEACAMLVAASIGLANHNKPDLELNYIVKPPVVVLSHDCDILLGNDKWTQGVRLYRCIKPIIKCKPPKLKNIKYIMENFLNPKKYYFDNILGMIEIERMHRATSSFYFLNGTSGRFGSRSGIKIIPEILNNIPKGWNVGMHYNHDTLLNEEKFTTQKDELENVINNRLVTGRAHYLRFNPENSFEFLENMGILCDGSVGYPDKIGYRCGIAGPFNPYDAKHNKKLNMLELPLVIMDGTLIEEYPNSAEEVFKNMLVHLSKIGGAITILWHPGMFYNSEVPETFKLYLDILGITNEIGAICGNSSCFVSG